MGLIRRNAIPESPTAEGKEIAEIRAQRPPGRARGKKP